jgi:WD40 repeat protein
MDPCLTRRIMSCAKGGTVRFWDAGNGKLLFATPDFGQLAGGLMADAMLSPDGKYFIALYSGIAHFDKRDGKRVEYTDRVARLYDAAAGKQLAVLRGHKGRVKTSSGDISAPPVESDPEEIRVPEPVGSQGHNASDSGFPPFNEREKTLARVWEADTGKEITTILKPTGFFGKQTEVPRFGHFSPDGKLAALGFMDDAQVWDVVVGKMLFKLKHGGMSGEDHAAWSPDGKRLATIRGNYVSIWDATDGKELTTLRGHESVLGTLSFSSDGKLALTTSWHRTARVWNAETGEQATVLRGHKSRVHTATLSPDGQRVVTAGEDGTVRVWWLNQPRDQARPLAEPIVPHLGPRAAAHRHPT